MRSGGRDPLSNSVFSPPVPLMSCHSLTSHLPFCLCWDLLLLFWSFRFLPHSPCVLFRRVMLQISRKEKRQEAAARAKFQGKYRQRERRRNGKKADTVRWGKVEWRENAASPSLCVCVTIESRVMQKERKSDSWIWRWRRERRRKKYEEDYYCTRVTPAEISFHIHSSFMIEG